VPIFIRFEAGWFFASKGLGLKALSTLAPRTTEQLQTIKAEINQLCAYGFLVGTVRRSEASTDIMAERRSYRRPQHQLPQQERTVQQRQPLVAVAGLVVGLLAGVGVERLLQAAFPAWTTAFTRWRM